jgi:hypothetical protein
MRHSPAGCAPTSPPRGGRVRRDRATSPCAGISNGDRALRLHLARLEVEAELHKIKRRLESAARCLRRVERGGRRRRRRVRRAARSFAEPCWLPKRWRPPMKWMTAPGLSRRSTACPWLIRRWIDPEAGFLFVPARC